ncbi:RTN1 protein, partial [Locustella ochotensis]|nr:RTN1 protein [Locustella ochotensis]
MSAPPEPQELLLAGSGAHWAAEGAEHPLRDGDGAEPREQLRFGSAGEHPPVTTATASPGVTGSSHLFDYGSTANGGDNSFYTSLISDVHYTTPRDSTYFTGIYQQENTPIPYSGSTEGFNALGHPVQDVTGFESRGLFSSDSGIEMTPAESTEVDKTLADPMKVEAYKYMDMSRSEEIKYQEKHDSDSEDESPGLSDKYRGAPAGSNHAAEPPRTPLESTKEQALLEDRKSGGQHSPSVATTPVKITLTETESTKEAASKEPSPTQPDTGLKPSREVVPTVTVSEPEDDSPGSVTPPSSGTEPSGSESQGKGSLSEDELISAIKEAKSFSFEPQEAQRSPAPAAEKREQRAKPGRPPSSSSHADHEASSAESGDSEIELVSEDPLAAEEALHSNYMTFSHIGGPPPSPASPSIQYSILREEREAELDSELIIESCDASSASEESPKREQQDSPLMKPKVMDIIKEENNSRADASDYEAGEVTESRMNRENLAESSSYLKSSFAAPKIGAEPPTSAVSTEELKERVILKKPIEETVVNQSKVSSKDFGKKSPLASFLLPFLNKQKAIDLLYWRDIKQTGIVFGSLLLLLFSLTQFSVVSVVAYLALAGLSATISFRIYKSVLQAVQKTDEGHPFKAYLEMEMNLSQDQIQKYTDCLQLYVNSTVKELRRLFLVQDLVDSLKFAVLMWLLTYVGALFNGLTLLIMAVVSMFTLPVVYDKYQAQIDQYLGLVRTHINTVVAKIQAKIPGAKRKAE